MDTQQTKPDPEQYARVVLWHLSEIRATVGILQARVVSLEQDPSSKDARQALISDNAKIRVAAEAFYNQALKLANIPPTANFPPPGLESIFGGFKK
ncbi:MAG TPA: hypothetical protein VMF08_13035 [Candidatus Sulfotelmatobacter sp.]|nr:hypothetical protein [Candidatus Sulfotelmatobacter sp.]